MNRMAQSKGMYVCLQLTAAFCLGTAWLVSGGGMVRSVIGYWIGGLLLFVSCLACLIRTVRTPYAEECAGGLNPVFHGAAALFFAASAVHCAGEYGILPDMAGILEMFRYDFDDGLANAVASFGFIASIVGMIASVLLVYMCVSVRKSVRKTA